MLEPRARSRIAESVDEVDHLRSELDGWLATVSSVAALGQHQTQLDTLAAVLTPVLAQVRRQVDDLSSSLATASVYDECRRADRRVIFLRRLWQWFAVRFDQRRDRYGEVLRSADEVVWSCWARTWQDAGGARPRPAPLPYVDAQFGASTNPRVDVPADLRAVADATMAAQVKAMPVRAAQRPVPWSIHLHDPNPGTGNQTRSRGAAFRPSSIG